MGVNGDSSDRSLWHDIVSSLIHKIDKSGFATRGGAEWVRIPNQGIYKFENDFSAIKDEESIYMAGISIPEVRVTKLKPEPWDESGTMASFSANSEVAALRQYSRKNDGIDGLTDEANLKGLPPLQNNPPTGNKLRVMTETDYLAALIRVREETTHYHRWTSGEKGRMYWKKTPVRTGSEVAKSKVVIEGDNDASIFDHLLVQGLQKAKGAKRTVWSKSDFRRYTINSHPALARAMSRILKEPGGKEKVLGFMKEAAPEIAAEFERVTGRMVMGLSVHFDSNMPHWNLWHCGIERVNYKIRDNGNDRIRYRRTAFNFNASGPGLLAWDRTRRSFERQGRDFSQTCKWTQKELDDAESECKKRQGRRPGDWVVNEFADKVLEKLLINDGWQPEVEDGFTAFVDNEVRRYEAGMAGRGVKNLKKIAGEMQLNEVQDLAGSLLDLRQELKKAQQAEIEITKELKSLRLLRELMQRFWDRLISTGKMVKLLELVGKQAREIIGLIAKEIGRNLPNKNGPEI